MNSSKQEIGWRPFWFVIRGYQIVIVVFAFVIGIIRPPSRTTDAVLAVSVGLLVMLVFDMFVRGTANERGITFTRYRDEQFVPWRDVEEVAWNPKAIRIKLRDRHFLRRYLQFALKHDLRKGIAFTFGGNVQEPDFVAWLRASGCLPEKRIRRQNRWGW